MTPLSAPPASATLQLAEQLISHQSVTPLDAGCLDIIAERLAPLGFICERMDSGAGDLRVSNLWAKREAFIRVSQYGRAKAAPEIVATATPPSAKTLVFAGHTDVVPTGPLAHWHSAPFTPTQRGGMLYGRGAADMKSSIAAMVVAVEEFLGAHPQPALSIAFLLTSDEEGPAREGTVRVCEALAERGDVLDYCIVGEPTSVTRLGDTIKNGRRGTMSGKLSVKGLQGHIAYPHLAKNPVHLFAPALAELAATHWDSGNDFFPATSWQVSNIHGGTGASNIIPGELVVDFNFRFCTESTPEGLQRRLCALLDAHGLDYELTWTIGGLPFMTTPGALVEAMHSAIEAATGLTPALSTTGGTSDGRFISKICPQVVEFGPVNASIHQIDECIEIASLAPLKEVYKGVLLRLAGLQP